MLRLPDGLGRTDMVGKPVGLLKGVQSPLIDHRSRKREHGDQPDRERKNKTLLACMRRLVSQSKPLLTQEKLRPGTYLSRQPDVS